MTRRISSIALVIAILSIATSSAVAADSVYWVDYERAAISHADISGGGATDVPIPADLIEGPYGTALDPAEGKLYWTNWNTNSIGVANLDGSGAALLNTEGATVAGPSGLAIDPGRAPDLLGQLGIGGQRPSRHDLLRQPERIRRRRPEHHRGDGLRTVQRRDRPRWRPPLLDERLRHQRLDLIRESGRVGWR